MGVIQSVLRHSSLEELLQSLSLLIRKMGMMMQTLGFHSAIH